MVTKDKIIVFTIILASAAVIGLSIKAENTIMQLEQLEQTVTSLETSNTLYMDSVEMLQKAVDEGAEENAFLTLRIQDLEESIFELNNISREQSLLISYQDNKELKDNHLVVPVFTANIDTYEKEVIYYISISKELSLEEKLNVISEKVSKYYYRNLPIELLSIDTIDGKKIAVFNLKESDVNRGIIEPDKIMGKTWKYHYFQGSAGGIATTINLIETFLQRDYTGEWIDGVRFIYYDDPDAQFEHIETIFNTNYR